MSQKLRNNNIFTIAKRNVEGQDMLYQSLKLTNGIWVLAELKIQPGNNNFTVSTCTIYYLIQVELLSSQIIEKIAYVMLSNITITTSYK